jgi:hypothetical protein
MPAELSDLRPYKSILVSRVQKGTKQKGLVAGVLASIGELVRTGANTFDLEVHDAHEASEVEAAFLAYREEKKVPWMVGGELLGSAKRFGPVSGQIRLRLGS